MAPQNRKPPEQTMPLAESVADGLDGLQLLFDTGVDFDALAEQHLKNVRLVDAERALMIVKGFTTILSIHSNRIQILAASMLMYHVADMVMQSGNPDAIDSFALVMLAAGRALENPPLSDDADEAGDGEMYGEDDGASEDDERHAIESYGMDETGDESNDGWDANGVIEDHDQSDDQTFDQAEDISRVAPRRDAGELHDDGGVRHAEGGQREGLRSTATARHQPGPSYEEVNEQPPNTPNMPPPPPPVSAHDGDRRAPQRAPSAPSEVNVPLTSRPSARAPASPSTAASARPGLADIPTRGVADDSESGEGRD